MAVLMSELGRTDPAAQAVTRSLLLRWRTDLATGVRAMQAAGSAPAGARSGTFRRSRRRRDTGGRGRLSATGSSADLEAVLDLLLDQLRPAEGLGSGRHQPHTTIELTQGPGH